MLPENSVPISEIMQTEEINPAVLDETPILNPSSHVEMTVKEEIDYPVELPEKKNDLISECSSVETLNSKFTTWENPTEQDFDEPVKGTTFNNSLDNINHPDARTLKNEAVNSSSHECSAVYSTLPHTVSSASSPSSQPKNERGRGRGRRRSRWKLKFHHQALPPEYLDHYEASMAQQEAAAAAAAAAAKPTAVKVENRNKVSATTTTAKPVTTFLARSTGTDKQEKVDKLVLPSSQCFVKLENEQMQFDRPISTSSSAAAASLLGNNNVMDQLHILPKQILSFRSDETNSQGQDEISIINEKPGHPSGKSHQNNDGCTGNKGLLGTLLTSTITSSEMGSKAINENECKRKSVIISSLSSGNNITESQPSSPGAGSRSCSKVRNYQDLPYMGEITLDNMKPRRGRKPKKADICHLIYKNYGTVLPGTSLHSSVGENEEWSRKKPQDSPQCSTAVSPLSHSDIRLKAESFAESTTKSRAPDSNRLSPHISHSDVQNRIISSLLEKRLTAASQEGKKMMYGNTYFASPTSGYERNDGNLVSSNQHLWNEHCKPTQSTSEEPLNLCVKDLNQLKIRLLRKHGNYYEPRMNDVAVKSEPFSPSDTEEIDSAEHQTENATKFLDEKDIESGGRNQVPPLLRNNNENNCESLMFLKNDCSKDPTPMHLSPETNSSNGPSLPGGYIYWPSAGVFVHPMALQSQFLYYQKMGAIPLVPLNPTETQTFLPAPIPHVNLIPHMSSTIPQNSQNNSPKNVPKKEQKALANKSLIPKAFSMMMDTSPKPSSSVSNEVSFSKAKRLVPLGTSASGTPMKRKRSAIFIPPMPSENSTNPTTEVSICKFKFTGGAKPSLQEKKMLSVDSGGNFRYYSGTGDKSMRGYEFFPREALQQSGAVGGSPSEQFLAASTIGSSDKIVGNPPTVFIPEESTPGHMKHLAGLSDSIMKVNVESLRSVDSENGVGEGSSSQNYESQALSGCVKKNIDLLTKGRNISCGESDRFKPIGSEDDQNTQAQARIRRKRKTRKSLAREKLEQTFKEKGFLIQTQQLESAEGATYCKFRQLRKFTRYLFRSWKDYLPGNVREMSVAAGVAGPDASPASEGGHLESEAEAELSCSNSPTPSVQQVSDSSKSFTNM